MAKRAASVDVRDLEWDSRSGRDEWDGWYWTRGWGWEWWEWWHGEWWVWRCVARWEREEQEGGWGASDGGGDAGGDPTWGEGDYYV